VRWNLGGRGDRTRRGRIVDLRLAVLVAPTVFM
jgi:hypothetical protein